MLLLVTPYLIATLWLALYGVHGLIFTVIFVWLRWFRPRPPAPLPPAEWPSVTVQLPIFNERYVVERLIDSVVALDYPRDRLHIQVLDDSTDDTAALARTKVAQSRAHGVNIDYIHRADRSGYKAGALAHGLARSTAEFVAVFDADFVPPADFLQRALPHFADPRLGLVQGRWGHLNCDSSLLTRAQAFFIDTHFGIEQTVRSRTGLFMNFNGSGGVWRRATIDDAGGWAADTLAEDLDLSYRAQLKGWRLIYQPDLVVPAEIPALLGGFKRQQFRWAKGSIQCLRKNGGRLMNSPDSLIRKLLGLMHLSGYLIHPLMMLVIVLSLPLVITGEITRIHLGAIGFAGFGAPIMFAIAQIALYPGQWRAKLVYLPAILFLGPGLALNNTAAIIEALIGRNPTLFLRTPKFQTDEQSKSADAAAYGLPVDWTTWAELFFTFYTLLTTVLALQHAPGLAPFTATYAFGFGYTACLGLRQSLGVSLKSIPGAVTTE